jgi:hypothetical protein
MLTSVLAVLTVLAAWYEAATMESFVPIFVGLVCLVGVILIYRQRVDRARAMCTPSCPSANRAVAYYGWEGTRQAFEISSESYASAFMVANQRKLVNLSPQAIALLQSRIEPAFANNAQSARRYVP